MVRRPTQLGKGVRGVIVASLGLLDRSIVAALLGENCPSKATGLRFWTTGWDGLGCAKGVVGGAKGRHCTHVETEAYSCYVEVVELWAGKRGWAFVVWVAEVALVGKHLFAREALSSDVSEQAPTNWN